MPTAGGLHTALVAGVEVGCELVQLFTTSPRQWKARELTDEQVGLFQSAMEEHGLRPISSHCSYLINPASADPLVLERSREALLGELQRCERLGVPYAVTHLGAAGAQTEQEAVTGLIESLKWVLERAETPGVTLLLETTAGQGGCLGHRFDQLQAIFEGMNAGERAGLCLDTCHIFAAGYDIRSADAYAQTMAELEERIGIRRIRLIHANDSRRELGSRVDRHQHIGSGEIGLEAFRLLLTDPRFASVPVVLETPKEGEMDPINLAALRRAAGIAGESDDHPVHNEE